MEGSLASVNANPVEGVPSHSTPKRRWGVLLMPVSFAGLAPFGFQVLAVTPIGNYFPSILVPLLHALSLFFAILAGLSIFIALGTLLWALIVWNGNKALSSSLLGVTMVAPLLVASMLAGAIGSTEVHFRALEKLSRTGMEVVTAVGEYERRFGRLPDSIDDLVPGVLAEVPKTGLPAYPDFEFIRLPIYGADMKGNPWMLSVPYTGLFIFPQFIYLPKKNYDEIETTGYIVGDWFYVDDEIRWPEPEMRRPHGEGNTFPTPPPAPTATPPSPLPPSPAAPTPPGTVPD